MKRKSQKIILFIVCFLSCIPDMLLSQKVTRMESFDNTTFPPFGWNQGVILGLDVNNYCERVTTGTSPICIPHTGSGMIRYRSGFMISPGKSCFLASPRFDLSNNSGTASVSFWMYKDNFNTTKDSVTLYINDSATANLSKGSMTRVIGPFSHDTTLAGTGWKQYIALIPANYASTSVYAVFVFTNCEAAAGGANIYIDDFSIETCPKKMSLISSTLFYQEESNITKNTVDQVIVGIRVVTDGAGDSLKVDSIVTNATGTTMLTDIVPFSCKVWYTKGRDSFYNSGNQFGTGLTPTLFRDKFTSADFFLENGDNYFWVSLSTSTVAINGNCLDINFNGIYYHDKPYNTIPDSSMAPLISSLPGCRQLNPGICGGIIPAYVTGTSRNNYINNDYINRVYLRGGNTTFPGYPYIDNNINSYGPSGSPWLSGPAPFTKHPPEYEQFSLTASTLHPQISAVLVQGATYSTPLLVNGNPVGAGLALQCGTHPTGNYIAAWIDFNNDGDLIDIGEKIHQSASMNANTWTFSPVTVPNNVGAGVYGIVDPARIVYGNRTLRIREVYGNSNIDPCLGGYNYGETEDYFVTVIPSCPAGIKLWLGFTDDWNTPNNWCGGIPTLNDIVVINEAGYLNGSQTGAPYDPVIHSGTQAKAKTIRLSDTDTLNINATSGSGLQIGDSLIISYNTPAGGGGLLNIISSYADTAQISNGNLQAALISPFMGTKKNARMQLIYTKSDLMSKGLIAGDFIDQFIFHIRARAITPISDYAGFSISYATVDSTWAKWPNGVPTYLAPATSAYVNVYSGTISLPMAAGTAGELIIPLTTNMYWNGNSDLVVDICFDNSLKSVAGISGFDMVTQTQTTGVNKTIWLYTNGINSGCSLAFPLPGGALATGSQFRPNITFHYHRQFDSFPVSITGNGAISAGSWVNHGNFIHGISEVIFSGSQNQYISGSNVTTFDQLTINKTAGRLYLNLNTNIDSALILQKGKLELNKNILKVNNTSNLAIQRISGGIISESVNPPYAAINWKLKSNGSNYVFPFLTSNTNDYVPLVFTPLSGNFGYVSASTYPANSKAKPYPTGVTNINDSLGNNDSAYTVKRFWVIDKSGNGGSANIKFSFRNTEAVAPINKINLRPNRYNTTTDLWQRFTQPVSTVIGGGISSSKISGVNWYNNTTQPWALSDATSPLRLATDDHFYARVFPNPFTESFIAQWDKSELFELSVFDLTGRKLFSKRFHSGDIINPGKQLINGIYLVEMKSEHHFEQFRMVKAE